MTNEEKTILKLIDSKKFDSVLSAVISDYCIGYLSRDYKTESAKRKAKTALNKVIALLPNRIQQYGWENYCILMNNIQDDRNIDRKKIVRIPLSEIYCKVISQVKELDYLKKEIDYFIADERVIDSELLTDRYYIGTNFPLASSLESLVLIEYPSRGKNRQMLSTIVNLNDSSSFVKEVLTDYLKTIEPVKCSYLIYRQFVYYFSRSLNKEVMNLSDFDFDLFKYQYRFYGRISRVSQSNQSLTFLKILINFYAYLFDVWYHQTGSYYLFQGNLIDKTILTSLKFSFAYENGYTFVEIPGLVQNRELNRIAVVSHDSKAHNRSSNLSYFDFRIIRSDMYREDVKTYFWGNNKLTTSSFSGRFKYIVDFLNLKTEFDSIVSSQSQMKNRKVIEIQAPFIYHYISYVRNTYDDPATIWHVFKAVRGFLNFHHKKYKIPKLMFNLLNEKNKNYDGGIVIDEDDLKLIFNRFKERKNESIRCELFYIIFVLCVTTKLRLGEILNLRMDYKVKSMSDSDVVTIKYYKKTSNSELVETQLSTAKATLLDRAIEITQEYRNKASKNLATNIFIFESKTYKGRILKATAQFQNYFSEIVLELKDQIKASYTPYNLRSTFIDNVYTKGIEQNISLLTLEEMTGNSSSIAVRHYVRKKDLLDYAEMFSGVQLSSMEINGEIVKDDSFVNEHSPVEDNLGGCLSNNCDDESEMYKCLICKKFVTSVSRIPAFERKINQLKSKRDNSLNKYEQKLINEELELYGLYYAKLIQLNMG